MSHYIPQYLIQTLYPISFMRPKVPKCAQWHTNDRRNNKITNLRLIKVCKVARVDDPCYKSNIYHLISMIPKNCYIIKKIYMHFKARACFLLCPNSEFGRKYLQQKCHRADIVNFLAICYNWILISLRPSKLGPIIGTILIEAILYWPSKSIPKK